MATNLPDIDSLRVRPGAAIDLRTVPTKPVTKVGKKEARTALAHITADNADLQETLYATGERAVLLVFQAMDAAGKDGTISHVLSGINPQGCQVTAFKQPSTEELAHDFLWRVNRALPERGHIGVFNRSHYEETIVVRVHPELLAKQHLPGTGRPTRRLWRERYDSINAFERHVSRNGTRIVKFFLHVSPDEQRKRLLKRLDDPAKHWKFDPGDLAERARWDDYMTAYADTIRATSKPWAPWYVIPADDKPTMRLLVGHVLRETLRGLDLKPPQPDEEWRAEAEKARAELA